MVERSILTKKDLSAREPHKISRTESVTALKDAAKCQGVRSVGKGHFQWRGSNRPNLGKDSGHSE